MRTRARLGEIKQSELDPEVKKIWYSKWNEPEFCLVPAPVEQPDLAAAAFSKTMWRRVMESDILRDVEKAILQAMIEGDSAQTIGLELGKSRARISQLERRAFRKIRQSLTNPASRKPQ